MDGRQRFHETMQYGKPDRLPRFEEGVRQEVASSWVRQGMPEGVDLVDFFRYDQREEVEVDLEPHPQPKRWPSSSADLEDFKRRLDQDAHSRLPKGWRDHAAKWESRPYPLILRLQRGFFLSMGVEAWDSFNPVIALTKDDPVFVAELLRLQGELSARLADMFLQEVTVDAALFSEPIGGNHGSLISPNMYKELVLPGLQPIMNVLKKHQVPLTIVRTYANPRPLIPVFLEAGINCLWAVEAPPDAMGFPRIRREYGRSLRLIGGIDTDVLRGGTISIQKEIDKITPLAAEGGYIPLLDGRVREDVSYKDYVYYRRLLEEVTGS